MTVVGFNFTKIDVERNESPKGKINISSNISVKDIVQKDLSLGGEKQSALRFVFEFISSYEPNVGKILLIGDVLYLGDAKKNKDILDQWKKEKKVAKEIMTSILNTVLSKCHIQALILSQEVNLPPPIPMPKVSVKTGP